VLLVLRPDGCTAGFPGTEGVRIGPRTRSGLSWRGHKFVALSYVELRFLVRPAHSLVTVLTSHLSPGIRKRKQRTSDTVDTYRGADKSVARPTSRCILFDGEYISFDASLVIYIYIYIYIYNTNIPPVMFINRIYELQIFCRCSLFPSWSG
jgi:hypothetical protein